MKPPKKISLPPKEKTATVADLSVPDTCAISDLQMLIASGKKFRTIYADSKGASLRIVLIHAQEGPATPLSPR